MIKESSSIDMTTGVAWRQLIIFAVPILLGELFQQSYNIVDSAIIGNFAGGNALAAVGAAESITKTLIGFFNGVSLGCTVVVARCFGEKNGEKLRQTVHTIVCTALILGAILSAVGLLAMNSMLRLMSTPANILPMARWYLGICFLGLSGLILYNTISGILRAVGDSRRPLYFLIFSSVLNSVLDWLFIAVWSWGVIGAALATICAQFLSAILCLYALMHSDTQWRFQFAGKIDRDVLRNVMRTGIPVGLQKTITSLSNVIILSHIAYFGADCMAGWVIYTKVSHILTVVAQSLSSAETTFISQNIGAKQYRRAAQAIQVAFPTSLVVVAVLVALVYAFHIPIIRFFGSEPTIFPYARDFLLGLVIFQLIHVFTVTYIAALRGMGHAAIGTVFSIVGQVGVRQIYLMSITQIINTPFSVGLAYPIGWFAAGAMMCAYYYLYAKKRMMQTDP